MEGGIMIVNIKLIGANCSNGIKILKNLAKVEREMNVEFHIEKIDSALKEKYHVNVTPALIIEDQMVSSGNVLSDKEIKHYVKQFCLDL